MPYEWAQTINSALTLQIVVVGVLRHAAVDEGPCQVVDCILLVLYRLGNHLGVEVVVETVVQVGLLGRKTIMVHFQYANEV